MKKACAGKLLVRIAPETEPFRIPAPILEPTPYTERLRSIVPDLHEPPFAAVIELLVVLHNPYSCGVCGDASPNDKVPAGCLRLKAMHTFVGHCRALRLPTISRRLAEIPTRPGTVGELREAVTLLQSVAGEVSRVAIARDEKLVPAPAPVFGMHPKRRKVLVGLLRSMIGAKVSQGASWTVQRTSSELSKLLRRAGVQVEDRRLEAIVALTNRDESEWTDDTLGWGRDLHVVAFVLAVAKYSFDPSTSRSKATARIRQDTEIDNTTLLRILREGAAEVSTSDDQA